MLNIPQFSRAARLVLPISCALAATALQGGDDNLETRPAPARFVKTELSRGEFYEPTEMAILPNLDVLITQRRGEILHYDASDEEVYRVGFLDAYYASDAEGVNAEEGVLGIVADPDFEKNHFIYIFYSPREKSVNRLSRFVFKDGVLEMDSETTVLEFYSQRDICCHTGGSLAFGKDRILYLSTGDNSTPFDEEGADHVNEGFAPLNQRPGKEQYDARRSSANTNDLRGKILRIRILEDGTYEIPEGNLFPDTDKTRPEIFTMGHRNPYRISVDRKTGAVYWGDVGPDANYDKPSRGPRGYDEMNRATEAGNYGWPLFIGDNYAYREFDYETGESGAAFDAQRPLNDSINNTGLHELPPAQSPFIWYPYAESLEFPIVGSGGRNAMAGPVYRKDFYPDETRLPSYYDDRVFMYDWIRNWFIAVELDADGKLASAEPFLEHMDFAGPIDVEMGPDGRLYVLEYGSGWFQKNADSGLSRIDYRSGNLAPTIESVSVAKTTGLTPLTVQATATVSDYEGDPLSFVWKIGEREFPSESASLSTQLAHEGHYLLTLTAIDSSGDRTTSQPIELYAGNERPEITIEIKGNQSFYFLDEPVAYRVAIRDDSRVIKANASVSAEMTRQAPTPSLGHKILTPVDEGGLLISGSDCRACHTLDQPSIGPSYLRIAERYAGDSSAETRLSNKILTGGAGVWGEVPMPAHPSLSESDVSRMVAWIRSHVAEEEDSVANLPLRGGFDASQLPTTQRERVLTFRASYTDSPGPGLESLSASTATALRPSALNRRNLDQSDGFNTLGIALSYAQPKALIRVDQVDLRGIRSLILRHDRPVTDAGKVSVRLDSDDGDEIGSATLHGESDVRIGLNPAAVHGAKRDIYLVFDFDEKPQSDALLQLVEFSKKRP